MQSMQQQQQQQRQQQQQQPPPQSQLNCQHTGACSCAAGSSRPQVLGADQLEGSQLPWKQPALPLQEERVALQERAVPLRVRELITEITSSLASGDRSVERADIVDEQEARSMIPVEVPGLRRPGLRLLLRQQSPALALPH
eukprot:COSAG01_NODE_3363_length_6195_cov_4.239665_6_plen_141_part_00